MLKTKKQIAVILLLFAITLCFALLFCGCKKNPKSTNYDEPDTPEEVITHTITLNYGILNNIIENAPETLSISDGTLLSLNDEVIQAILENLPEGFLFEQIKLWDQNGDTFSSIEVTSDLTLFFVFSKIPLEITFCYDEHELVLQKTFELEDEINIEDVLKDQTLENFQQEKKGLYFKGWTTSQHEVFSFNTYVPKITDEEGNEHIITPEEFVLSYLEKYPTITKIQIKDNNTRLYALYAPEKYEGVSVEGMEKTSFYYGEPFDETDYGYVYNENNITNCPDLGHNNENVGVIIKKFTPQVGVTNLFVMVDGVRFDFATLNTFDDLTSPIHINPEFNLNISYLVYNGKKFAKNVSNLMSVASIFEAGDIPMDDEDDDEEIVNPALNGQNNQVWKIFEDITPLSKNGVWIYSGGDLQVGYVL